MLRKPTYFDSNKRDQLYQQIKVVLLVNMVLGVFPVKNCMKNSCQRLKFQWISLPVAYSVLLSVCVWLATVLDNVSSLTHFRRINIALQVECLVLIVINYHLISSKYIQLLHKVQAIDIEIMRLKLNESAKTLAFSIYVIVILIWMLTLYLELKHCKQWSELLAAACYFYMTNIRTLLTLPFIVTIYGIADRFKSINKDLRKTLFVKELTFGKSLYELERLRLLHLKLCLISEKLISGFSLLITVIFGFSYLDMLVKVGSIVTRNDFNWLLDSLLLGLIMSLSYVMICASEHLHQASQSVIYILRDLPLSDKPDSFYSQVKQFTIQVKSVNVQVSASNYFLLKKSSVPAMIGSMASFIVLVDQLVPKYEPSLFGVARPSNSTNGSSII